MNYIGVLSEKWCALYICSWYLRLSSGDIASMRLRSRLETKWMISSKTMQTMAMTPSMIRVIFMMLYPLGKVFENFEHKLALGKHHNPCSQKYEYEVRPETNMLLIPHFERTLVR